MKTIFIFIFFVCLLIQGCATPKKEKIGPLTGKTYDCKKPSEAEEYKKECATDKRNKCMAKLPQLSESDKMLIEKGRVAIGMKNDAVRCSYGEPAQVNRN